jgi:carboxyl-terminal processing protease
MTKQNVNRIGQNGCVQPVMWALFFSMATVTARGSLNDAAVTSEIPPSTPDPVLSMAKETLSLLETHKLQIDRSIGMSTVIESIVHLADPGAVVMESDFVKQQEALGAGDLYGVGLTVTRTNGIARIIGVQDGSPSAEAGLVSGDRIESVNGTGVAALNISTLVSMLRGESTGTVSLTIARSGEDARDVVLERKVVAVPAVAEMRTLPLSLHYVRINELTPEAADEVAESCLAWMGEGSGGIILDLRSAGGTNVEAAVKIASPITESNRPLFTYRDGDDQELAVYKSEPSAQLKVPLMLLVNDRTRGAAEVLVATLAGIGRGAMLIGEGSAGDPLIRQQVEMSNGTYIRLATRRLVISNGEVYSGRQAVQPDIRVDDDVPVEEYEPDPPLLTDHRGVSDGELEVKALRRLIHGDAMLVRAADVLLGLRALNIQGFEYGAAATD